ncbi:MAG: hypothetical protein LJE75_12335, partial [Gammaproteobacteria bacterium]|nr:hypothetical protein [Gammaproteobacteria bacterium]
MTMTAIHERTKTTVMALRMMILLAAITLPFPGVAGSSSDSDWRKPAHESLAAAQQLLQSFDPSTGDTGALDPWDNVLSEIRLNAQKCVETRQEEINSFKGPLNSPDDTALAAPQTRKRLDELETEMADCQTLLLKARTLGDEILSARQNVLKFRLLGRGPDLWSVGLANLRQANTLPAAVQAFLQDRVRVNRLQVNGWILLAILTTLGAMLGLWWRRRWRSRLMQGTREGISAKLSASLQA